MSVCVCVCLCTDLSVLGDGARVDLHDVQAGLFVRKLDICSIKITHVTYFTSPLEGKPTAKHYLVKGEQSRSGCRLIQVLWATSGERKPGNDDAIGVFSTTRA